MFIAKYLWNEDIKNSFVQPGTVNHWFVSVLFHKPGKFLIFSLYFPGSWQCLLLLLLLAISCHQEYIRSFYFKHYVLHSLNNPDILLWKNCVDSDKKDRFQAELYWVKRGHLPCRKNQYDKDFTNSGFVFCNMLGQYWNLFSILSPVWLFGIWNGLEQYVF